MYDKEILKYIGNVEQIGGVKSHQLNGLAVNEKDKSRFSY